MKTFARPMIRQWIRPVQKIYEKTPKSVRAKLQSKFFGSSKCPGWQNMGQAKNHTGNKIW